MDTTKDAYSILEFCQRHDLSRSGYYNMPLQDRPREMRVGSRVLISREAAEAWRRAREAAGEKVPA